MHHLLFQRMCCQFEDGISKPRVYPPVRGWAQDFMCMKGISYTPKYANHTYKLPFQLTCPLLSISLFSVQVKSLDQGGLAQSGQGLEVISLRDSDW